MVQRQTGLASEKSVIAYAAKVGDMFDKWAAKTPAVRMRNVVGAANLRLEKEKVTALKGIESDQANVGDAVFNFVTWQIEIDPRILHLNAVTNANAETLADRIYHEARHAEQWFRIARLKAGEGRTQAQLVADLAIPSHVARDAVARPLNPLTPAQRAAMRPAVAAAHDETVQEAGDWHASIYGAGRPHRDAVMANIPANYAAYRALAEEVDAWAVGAEAARVVGVLRRGGQP